MREMMDVGNSSHPMAPPLSDDSFSPNLVSRHLSFLSRNISHLFSKSWPKITLSRNCLQLWLGYPRWCLSAISQSYLLIWFPTVMDNDPTAVHVFVFLTNLSGLSCPWPWLGSPWSCASLAFEHNSFPFFPWLWLMTPTTMHVPSVISNCSPRPCTPLKLLQTHRFSFFSLANAH